MESYISKNKLLIDSGKTQQEIETSYNWSPLIMSISDTGQTFDDIEIRRTNRQKWHYAQGLNEYFLTTRSNHGLMTAFSGLFTTLRWEEIEHLLDEMDVHRLLLMGNLARLRKKVLRAQAKGLIDSAEVQAMAQVVNGS